MNIINILNVLTLLESYNDILKNFEIQNYDIFNLPYKYILK